MVTARSMEMIASLTVFYSLCQINFEKEKQTISEYFLYWLFF